MRKMSVAVPSDGEYQLGLLICDKILWDEVLTERYGVTIPESSIFRPDRTGLDRAMDTWFQCPQKDTYWDGYFIGDPTIEYSGPKVNFKNVRTCYRFYENLPETSANSNKISFALPNVPSINFSNLSVEQILEAK